MDSYVCECECERQRGKERYIERRMCVSLHVHVCSTEGDRETKIEGVCGERERQRKRLRKVCVYVRDFYSNKP